MQPAYVLSDTEPEPHGDLVDRYARHTRAAMAAHGTTRGFFHMMAARGLYRLLADIECSGGQPAPMGAPHFLCLTDTEVRALVKR
jgi:hypothetical protein